MTSSFYEGRGSRKSAFSPEQLPGATLAQQLIPEAYLPDPGLRDAVNVALMLGQPLLLTGEPGAGKTQLAYSVAWELGFSEPLRFDTKSTSTARDLFYYYDTLGRFHASQSGKGSREALDYITYNALGIAILRSQPKDAVAHLIPEAFVHEGPKRSLVLIDEVDKAPRDFPNDLLNEVEEMYFQIPELGNAKVRADAGVRPVVVITSNSEKHLPDAFLRRCIYYHIPFPDRERMSSIVASRLGALSQPDGFLKDALDLFFRLRDDGTGLRKKPSTAELLGWLTALRSLAPEAQNPIRERPELAERTVSSLVKTPEDFTIATQIAREWHNERKP